MTREEEKIKAGRDFIIRNYGKQIPTLLAFEAGFDSADENPKNQWRDAMVDPPKDIKPVVGYVDGIIDVYEYSPEEKIWSIGMLLSDAPEYWIPMPEKLKGGTQ